MKNDDRARTIRISIIVLAGLLAISVTALAGTMIYRHFTRSEWSPAVSPDNVITPGVAETVPGEDDSKDDHVESKPGSTENEDNSEPDNAEGETVTLKIYRSHTEDASPFQVNNLFPGDSVKKTYSLEASYKGSVTVHFHADIRSGYEKLAEVLKCKVSIQGGEVLYDGLMKEMPERLSYALPQSSGSTERFWYDVTVYLDTSVGNEYMEKVLYADFRWWIEENNSGSTGELLPPKTGDDFDTIIWLTVAAVSLLCILILVVRRKTWKGEEKLHE